MSRSLTASAGKVQRSASRKASRVNPPYATRGVQTFQAKFVGRSFVGRSFIRSALQLVRRDAERRVDEHGIVRASRDADPADLHDARAALERLHEQRDALQLDPGEVHLD